MPGLPCVYLMLPGPLGQAILEADEKEAINSSSDLAKIGELVAAEEAKNPEIRSVQYPGREQQASAVAMRFAPLLFLNNDRPVAHATFMGENAPETREAPPKITPSLLWVKDQAGNLVAGKQMEGDDLAQVMTFPKKDPDSVFTAFCVYSDGSMWKSSPTA